MPREITETTRHQQSALEQRRMAVGSRDTWLRIDKGDGFICIVGSVNVLRAAQGSFDKAGEVIATGRFQTPYAIYSRGDQLTVEERAELS